MISRSAAAFLIVISIAACSGITDTQLPDGVESPSMYNNKAGAIRLTQAATSKLASAIANYVVVSGMLTDELMAVPGSNNQSAAVDWRSTRASGGAGPYGLLHEVRSLSRLARGVVRTYVEGETSAWQAQLFLYEAYAEILLADGWCSGVPLSTLDFEADWTYQPGSTTEQVYEHAILLLDSAYERAADSVQLQFAISTLKARAQVSLGKYADAKSTAQSIDGASRYNLWIAFDDIAAGVISSMPRPYERFISQATISDKEGINGLSYLSSGDPRTHATQITSPSAPSVWFPTKYVATDSSVFTLASGIEAKLILAEIALKDNNPQQFILLLNSLRTTGTYLSIDTTYSSSDGSEIIDTLWNEGLGHVAGLGPLTDPGLEKSRLQLLFIERAAWLFVTGARQGDLRRLVRNYGWDREQVYPTGTYTGPGNIDVYGTDISFGMPASEYTNPHFKGCLDND